ncbi:MAG: fasciclin domain-containing protein [Balneolia bacterium]|nr:fasciclin domain-containing protein [Balneolia bacterium]
MRTALYLMIASMLLFFTACDVVDSTSDRSEVSNISENLISQTLERGGPPSAGNTIVDIAAGNEDFSILVDAVVFAGLDGALSSRRQLTVFAPTDDAFIALLEALELTPEELFVEENKDLIRSILLYHVAPGNRDSGAVTTSDQINTLQGFFIKVKEENGSFLVGNDENGFAEIIAVDINASNGVIHVIDSVMLPPSENDDNGDNGNGDEPADQSIVEIAAGNEDFSILVDAVVFAGLVDVLDGNRQFTVFAPTNDAFVALLETLELTAEELFAEGNEELVRNILLYHVAPGNRPAADVVSSTRIRTMNRSFVFVDEENGDFFVGNDNGFAQIVATDIFARNGVIHVIDAVMLP